MKLANSIPDRPARGAGLAAAAAVLAGLAFPAQAYVGPGAGLSLLGALWALILAVATAVFFIIAWPVRRMMRRRRDTASRIGDTAGLTTQPSRAATRPVSGEQTPRQQPPRR